MQDNTSFRAGENRSNIATITVVLVVLIVLGVGYVLFRGKSMESVITEAPATEQPAESVEFGSAIQLPPVDGANTDIRVQ